MILKSIQLSLLISLLTLVPSASAQPNSTDVILFVWNDTLIAQPLSSSEIIAVPERITNAGLMPPTRYGNRFDHANSPLTEPPIDGYGFYQGIWSADSSVFAYLAIQPDAAGYHVVQVENAQQRVLFSGTVNPERGYLVPVAWADDGSLILLERHMLHNLNGVIRLWTYPGVDAAPVLRHAVPIPDLKGNSASLGDGRVFVGFDTVGMRGYVIDTETGTLTTFNTGFALIDPPPSVFETYPVQVVGVGSIASFGPWLAQYSQADTLPPARQVAHSEPFLHWPLPDHARSITCYPDSEWTDSLYAVECPGLATPRAYPGHEGTDIGGRPNGLDIGTHVFAAAPGLVIRQLVTCVGDDITCGDAYGNHVLIEHSRVVGQDVETWFTGYAHLQMVLVEPFSYVSEIGVPIALSGDTGLGGAHLHFEVRSPGHLSPANWLDPWDTRTGSRLWIDRNEAPLSAVVAAPPPTQMICRTLTGNNIRSGPGTQYAIVTESVAETEYAVFQVQRIVGGGTPGDWYHIRWVGAEATGWIWSDLMTDCTPVD